MPKRILKGKVVSDKMRHTVVVSVTALKPHPKYHKRIRVTQKYKAHSEGFDLKVGDIVNIEECRPISKDKHWVVKDLLRVSQTSPLADGMESSQLDTRSSP